MAERDEFDDNGGTDGGSDDTPLVKDLRKQLRAAKAAIDEHVSTIDKLSTSSRERSVKDVLTAKGVRPGVAKHIPKDIVSEEDVLKWLTENAEDFGLTFDSDGDSQDQGDPDPVVTNAGRARSLTDRGVAPSKMADLDARLAKAESSAEVDQILAEARSLVM